jgi:hypothetical protein
MSRRSKDSSQEKQEKDKKNQAEAQPNKEKLKFLVAVMKIVFRNF